MVNNPSFDTIIHWTPDGLGFNVTDANIFASTVLLAVFKHNNVSQHGYHRKERMNDRALPFQFQSFVRQLNMYDFNTQNRVS